MPRVVRFYQIGGPEVLRLEELPRGEPGPGEVRLRIEAFGLNNSELQYRRGEYPLGEAVLPSRIGKEAVGLVEAVGSGVTGVAAGHRVTTIPCFAMDRYGVYGETAIVPAAALAPCPAGLSVVEAAAIWQAYLTVYGPFVEYGLVRKVDTVLVTAAASSVGHAAIQISHVLGATVIATTRHPAKRAALRKGGADHVIVTGEEDLVERVRALTGSRGATVIFDAVAGPGLATLAEAAAPEGTIVLYGTLDQRPAPFPLLAALKKGLCFRGYTMWEIMNDPIRLARGKEFVLAHITAGALRPVIDRTFPLESIAEAHRYMESSEHCGKIVVMA